MEDPRAALPEAHEEFLAEPLDLNDRFHLSSPSPV
jgi:hypothetical protein